MVRTRELVRGAATIGLVAGSMGAAPPPPRLPEPPELVEHGHSGRLHLSPRADGTYRYVDHDAHFEAILHADGRMEIRDTPKIEADFEDPREVVYWLLNRGKARDHKLRDPERDDPQAQLDAVTDLTPPSPYGPAPILIGIGFHMGGLFDILTRRGQRRNVKAKQELLERTAPLREALARQRDRQHRIAAQVRLGQELASAWHDRDGTLAERKRALFERWDECVESEPGRVDDPLLDGGEIMRRRIEAFIREVAPPGSAEAFDAEELRRFNAGRHSRQRFDPYTVVVEREPEDEPAVADATR